MKFLVKLSPAFVILGSGIVLAANEVNGDVAPLWWILWGVFSAVIAVAEFYRIRISRS